MKTTSEQLKDTILSLTQDVVFVYNGITCCINPWNTSKFELGYDDTVRVYDDIDELMNDEIFDGQSLNDIADNIDIE